MSARSLPHPTGRLLPAWDRRRVTLLSVSLGFVGLTVLSLQLTDISFGTLLDGLDAVASNDAERAPQSLLRRMLDLSPGQDLWNPIHVVQALVAIVLGTNLPEGAIEMSQILAKTVETVWIAVLGTTMAAVISVPIALLAAQNTTPNRLAFGAARGLIVGSRAIPDLVFAIIFVRALGLGVLPGVLAVGLHAMGMLGKLFADAIEEIDEGVRHAVEATGASRLQVLTSAVLPQLVPTFVSVSLYRLDINFRASVILGFVGAGGIGQLLNATFNNLRYQEALRIVLIIMVFVVLVEMLSSAMRRALVGVGTDEPRSRTAAAAVRAARSVTRSSVPKTGDVESEIEMRLAGVGAGAPPAPGSAGQVSDFDHRKVLPPWTRQRVRQTGYWALLATLVLASAVAVGVWPWETVNALLWDIPFNRTANGELFVLQFVPDFGTAIEAGVVGDIIETVAIGLVATFFGLMLAIPFGFLSARNIAPSPRIAAVGRYFLVVERSIPELVYALIFIAGVGLGPFPGVMALVMFTLGFVAKLIADALEQVDEGPRQAVTATGASRLQERVSAVIPQVTPGLIGNSLYMLDVNIRSSTILGIVGGGGIGFLLLNSTKVLEFDVTAAILVMIFAVVYSIERLANWIRSQLI